MKLSIALIAALLCTAAPAKAQAQPATTNSQPAHVPGQTAPKTATAAATKPAEKLDPAKEAAIRHLLDLTQTSKMGENLNLGFTAEVKRQMSGAIPPEQLPKFMETFTQKYTPNAPPSAVTDAIVSIYAKAFTMEDILGLTKFYESALGQHAVQVMPQVSQESQYAGVQIDRPKVIATLRGMETDYPQLKQMLPPDPSAPADAAPAGTPPATSSAPSTPPTPKPSTIGPPQS